MALASYLVFFFLISHQLLLSLSELEYDNPRCPPFSCGRLGSIGFPFSNRTHPECGLLIVDNCTQYYETIQLPKNNSFFYIEEIAQDNTIELHDQPFRNAFDNHTCKSFRNLIFHRSPFISFNITYKHPVFKCPPNTRYAIPTNYSSLCNYSTYSVISRDPPNFPTKKLYPSNCNHSLNDDPPAPPAQCSVFWPRVTETQKHHVFDDIFAGSFTLQVKVTKECYVYSRRGGQCLSDSKGSFHCNRTDSTIGHHKLGWKLKLGIEIGVPTLFIGALALYITWRCKIFHPRYTSSDPSSKSDPEEASVYFGVPIFSYCELAKATKNFSHENELGKGGFGTVYHGKLRDGREVAVKRLYEHNHRRVEQFMNEIKILTRLRHKNLVSLYGCTSCHSQGLLLVYEFIPNSTVANHLHGDRANPCLLTWPIRMNIAIETALALAYLHASDIIHRDVKTNNILLDNNFSVKVVDFGLSRLFPTDVTHVSTAPQGTPGYVDPEYHQCYQLTEKSDVYSFGVVLIELISSMPAVDISRDKHEINLANLAINKIQKRAVEELIDPCLGFLLDEEVKRMATSVTELAFLCLQQSKEMRPSMDAVLEQLLRIKSREYKQENLKEEDDDDKEESKSMLQPPPPPLHYAETCLLENMKMPPSPISVTENWVSNSTTSNVSYYSTTSNISN